MKSSSLWPTNFILLIIVFSCALFLVMAPNFSSLDTRFYYSMEEANFLFANLENVGRESYFYFEIFDLIFIFLYTVLSVQIARFIIVKSSSKFSNHIFFISIIPGFLDVIETSGILLALSMWPNAPAWLLRTLSVVTPLKWLSGVILCITFSLPYIVSKKR